MDLWSFGVSSTWSQKSVSMRGFDVNVQVYDKNRPALSLDQSNTQSGCNQEMWTDYPPDC